MPCYNPLQAYFSYESSGKRNVKFSNVRAELFQKGAVISDFSGNCLTLPCGRCIGCRLEHSRTWAVRCMHESQMHQDNCFITLTYNDKKLPKDGSLVKSHFQSFMKRFRYHVGVPIRYYMCGEYGDNLSRPHYHACIFGYDFVDKLIFNKTDNGYLYESKLLSDVWGNGFCTVADLTFESAAYVARYCTKKVTGAMAQDHYGDRIPEYAAMSRRPGIGRTWYDRYKSDLYPSDYVVVNGVKSGIPRFYDFCLESEDPVLMNELKLKRISRLPLHADDNTFRRLQDREYCQKERCKQLLRKLEC